MKLSFVPLIVAALAALVNAAILTNNEYTVTAGVPFKITWSGASGPVTITLKTGPSGNLKTVEVLVDGATGGSFTWTPPKTLATGTYAFEITDSSGVNYSPQFEFSGGPATSTDSDTSSTSATKTSSDSSTDTKTSTSSKSSSTSSATSSNTTMTTSTASTTQSGSTTSSRSPTSSSASATPTRTSVPNSNDGQRFASPLAFVLVTIAALVFMN